MTHPFHPLFGQWLEVVRVGRHLGEDVVWYRRPDGSGCSRMLVCWTSLAGIDGEQGAGRAEEVVPSFFVWEDLVRLARLVELMCQADSASTGKKILP